VTATVLATPDHFPLNPKTTREGAIVIGPRALSTSAAAPYAFDVAFHAMTVESVEQLRDGRQLVTLAFVGGPIERSDQNRYVTNFDGTEQEEYVYAGHDATAANNTVEVVIDKGTALFSRSGAIGPALGIELASGSADYDFIATLNYSPENVLPFSQLLNTAGKRIHSLRFTAASVAPNS